MTHDEKIVEAAREVLSHRVGDLPSQGWLRDNASSREALSKLAAAITAYQAEAWQPRATMPRDATISVVVAATDKNRTFAGRRDVLSVYIDSEGQFENDPENEFWAITHWQPLPNPPASP